MKKTIYSLFISLLLLNAIGPHTRAAEAGKTGTRTVAAKTAADRSPASGKKDATDLKATADRKSSDKDSQKSDEKKAEWIEKTLDYGIQEERLSAAGKIQQIKDPVIRGRLVKKLLEVIKDEEDPELLIKSITVLGEMKETSAIPLIISKIDHRTEDVGTAAVYALKKMNGTAAKEKLIQKLKSRDLENNSNFTGALIQTLGEFKAVELIPFVKESLESPKTTKGIREELVIFLGKAPAPESKDILLKIFKDEEEDATLRSYAVNSLSKLGSREVAADIKETIKTIDSYDVKKRKKYYYLYLYSIAALATLGDPEAVPKLINALRSNSSQVRLKAISLIKDFKDKRTIDILKYKMNYDPNPKVQAAARKALKEMGVDVGEEKKAEKKKDNTKSGAKKSK